MALADVDSNVQVTADTDTAMDVSGANSAMCGDDVGNLYETLDKIVEGAEGATTFVPEEDLSLSDLMVLIGEGGEVNKVELEVSGGEVNRIELEVAEGEVDVKCESEDRTDSAEHHDGGEVAKDSVTQADCSGVDDSVITVDNPVEMVKTTESPNDSGNLDDSVSGGAKSGSKDDSSGATFSPIQTISKYRLREIFRYANGNIYNLYAF